MSLPASTNGTRGASVRVSEGTLPPRCRVRPFTKEKPDKSICHLQPGSACSRSCGRIVIRRHITTRRDSATAMAPAASALAGPRVVDRPEEQFRSSFLKLRRMILEISQKHRVQLDEKHPLGRMHAPLRGCRKQTNHIRNSVDVSCAAANAARPSGDGHDRARRCRTDRKPPPSGRGSTPWWFRFRDGHQGYPTAAAATAGPAGASPATRRGRAMRLAPVRCRRPSRSCPASAPGRAWPPPATGTSPTGRWRGAGHRRRREIRPVWLALPPFAG